MADDADQFEAILKKHADIISKVESYRYIVRKYSEHSQNTQTLKYRQRGEAYYYEGEFRSPDPKKINMTDKQAWDGKRAMRLVSLDNMLTINNKPYPLTGDWTHLCGLFYTFRFVLEDTKDAGTTTPQLKDIANGLSRLIKNRNYILSNERIDNRDYLCLTSDGGFELTVRKAVKVKTYFSPENDCYPMIVDILSDKGVLIYRRIVEKLGYSLLGGQAGKIPYPQRIKNVCYLEDGRLANIVYSEFSDVLFNSDEIADFEIDPAEATGIIDQTMGNKYIPVPK